jgi:hypothetical protein
LPKVEQELTAQYSSVLGALPAVRDCLEAQKENVSDIVDSASKCPYSLSIHSVRGSHLRLNPNVCPTESVQFGYTPE